MYQLGQETAQALCGGYLCVLAALDIRFRRLPVWLLLAGIFCAAVYQGIWSDVPLALSMAGGATGIVFLVSGKVTEEAFGYGDGILILALGIYLGFWSLLGVLTAAFVLAAGFAMVVLVIKKFRKKTAFPFVPFLCMGYFLMCFTGALKL